LGKWVDEAYRVPGEFVIVDEGDPTSGTPDDDDPGG
jgi:hypothetical protein